MTTVQQLLDGKSNDIWSIHPDDSVFEAIQLMANRDVGALVVIESDQPVGLPEGESHGLLQRHRLAGGEGGQRGLGMQVMGQQNLDQIVARTEFGVVGQVGS